LEISLCVFRQGVIGVPKSLTLSVGLYCKSYDVRHLPELDAHRSDYTRSLVFTVWVARTNITKTTADPDRISGKHARTYYGTLAYVVDSALSDHT